MTITIRKYGSNLLTLSGLLIFTVAVYAAAKSGTNDANDFAISLSAFIGGLTTTAGAMFSNIIR